MQNKNIILSQLSDPGLVRANNEDRTAVDNIDSIAVLADGVGGQNCGETASALATTILVESFKEIKAAVINPKQDDFMRVESAMKEAVIKCSQQILDTATRQPQYQGMATTIVAAIFFEKKIAFIHVGDSRLYRFRKGQLEQLTKDHSLYQQAIDTQAAANTNEFINVPKNIITQALGLAIEIMPSCSVNTLQENDIYLFCSDGLNDTSTDDEISGILNSENNAELDTSKMLIDLALSNGGTDNVSVILAQVKNNNENSFIANAANFFFKKSRV